MNIARHVPHRGTVAILLALVLLFAQWTGMTHRIKHAPLAQVNVSAFTFQHDSDHHHSCIIFDAAAIADTVHIPQFVTPLPPGVQVLALWMAFRSWQAPLTLHFSSRAPPSDLTQTQYA